MFLGCQYGHGLPKSAVGAFYALTDTAIKASPAPALSLSDSNGLNDGDYWYQNHGGNTGSVRGHMLGSYSSDVLQLWRTKICTKTPTTLSR
jgi:hypothetical protein